MKLTQKQEAFTRLTFETNEPAQAYLQIYKCKSKGVASACATRLLKNAKIKAYLEDLNQQTEDASVASVLERKQILTEITRGNLLDYQETGADGAWLNIGKDSPHTKAVAEITSRTNEDDSVITRVKLHNPIQAITELNKMERIYETEGVKIDNRTINIYTNSEKAKELTERLIEGEGTE